MKKTLSIICAVIITVVMVSCSRQKKIAKQHNDMLDTYQTLKSEMPGAQVTMEGDKVKVVLPEAVLFSINSAEMNSSYFPILAKMANVLNKYNETNVLITGYTDISGTDALNQQLSKKRAESARDVLVKDKVSPSRIHTWGLGSKDPIADNKTEEGRKQNRRVEYVIMYGYKEAKK